MAFHGRVLACFAISLCVLIAGASAFPFTYPSAFPFGSSTPTVPAAVDQTSPPSPVYMQATPPPSSYQGTPSGQGGGQRNGGEVQEVGGGKVWCIAKPAVDEQTLVANIAYACEEGGIDCAPIQPGGACFTPKSLISHASFVMNMYYQKYQRNWWTCHFNHSGLVVFADPSFGDCIYSPQ